MKPDSLPRMERREAIKWMLAAGAGVLMARVPSLGATSPAEPHAGYGTDPDLMRAYKPGDYWPLTFDDAQRRQVAALCDVVIPADAVSPSASSVGVADFIDEWVSAPYPNNLEDRAVVLDGLAWLDSESQRRFGKSFADAADAQRVELCSAISPETAEPKNAPAFFKRFRNLTAAGFYTTPVGMKDLGYVGNVPLAQFDGPSQELVAKLGLADEVAW